jgi:hypothetical protein
VWFLSVTFLMLPKRLEDDLSSVPRYKPEKFNIDKFLAESEESVLFDKVFGLKSSHGKRGDPPQEMKAEPSQTEFTTLLSSRLVTVEQENKDLRRLLAQKTTKILALEDERTQLTDLLKSENRNADLLKNLKGENKRLQQQILEMEQFLADYGLTWVGHSKADQICSVEEPEPEMNFDRFVEKIAELNSFVLSEPAQVVTSTDGNRVRARLAHADQRLEHIPLTLYKDGIMIKRGPFREMGSDSFNSFVGDVLDGYFPSEFRGENPDGVILKLTDKRNELFLCSEGGVATGSKGSDSSLEDQQLRSVQFLSRLPKTVVKDGNLISVRDDVASRFGFASHSPPVAAQPTSSMATVKEGKNVICLRSPVQRIIESGGDLTDEIATVQIKWPAAAPGAFPVTYLAKVYASDFVADLKEALSREKRGEVDSIKFRGSHPPRVLEDTFTIRECGLVPNGTLHVERL